MQNAPVVAERGALAPRGFVLDRSAPRADESRRPLRPLGRRRAHNLPELVIHGAENRYVPAANAAALAESIPGSRLRVLDHAGHLVFIERLAEVNREVVSFLKEPKKRGTRRPRGPYRVIYRWIRRVLAPFS